MAQVRLTKFQKIFLLVFLLSAAGLWLWSWRWPTAVIELGGETLEVLVAKSPRHQYRGLGRRDTLSPYDGMLFVFTITHRVGIVMRDMRFPLDIIWLNKGEVVDIAPNVPLEPGRDASELTVYRPRLSANTVLELPAGWVEEHGLKIGDRLRVLKE